MNLYRNMLYINIPWYGNNTIILLLWIQWKHISLLSSVSLFLSSKHTLPHEILWHGAIHTPTYFEKQKTGSHRHMQTHTVSYTCIWAVMFGRLKGISPHRTETETRGAWWSDIWVCHVLINLQCFCYRYHVDVIRERCQMIGGFPEGGAARSCFWWCSTSMTSAPPRTRARAKFTLQRTSACGNRWLCGFNCFILIENSFLQTWHW